MYKRRVARNDTSSESSSSGDDEIYWLTPLYDFDNRDCLRVVQTGYSAGRYYSGSGLVYKQDGNPGVITPKERKVPTTTTNPHPLDAARAKAQQEWDKKYNNSPYQPSKTVPDCTVEEWRAQETRRWPSVCANFKDVKVQHIDCDTDNPWWMQPKINGDRTIARSVDGEVKLYSRNCQEKFFLDSLRAECKRFLRVLVKNYPELGTVEDFALDGESLIPDAKFHQQSRSIMGRSVNRHEHEDRIVLQVFDLQQYTLDFETRYTILSEMSEYINSRYSQIRIIPMKVATSITDIHDYKDECREKGYEEGIVLRRPSLLYTRKYEQRQKTMLKFKNVEDGEYVVTNYTSGEGDHEGCVVWEVQDPNNEDITFTCQYKDTLKVQRWFFQHGNEYIGRLLTVEYGSKSASGCPIFPVGVRFRDDDDLVPQ
jgi:hypothetical protein